MLDMVRYLVVWNPIIFLALHFIFREQPPPPPVPPLQQHRLLVAVLPCR